MLFDAVISNVAPICPSSFLSEEEFQGHFFVIALKNKEHSESFSQLLVSAGGCYPSVR